MQAGSVLLLILFSCSVVQGQTPHKQSGGPAEGSLRVTAIVESSVWLVMASDGNQETVVANAPDPKEAFFHVPAIKDRKTLAAPPSAAMPRAEKAGNQDHPAVQFSLAQDAKQFEVKHEIMMMNVSHDGKPGRQPVKVITVVPR
ncbi:MAG TPA: hypothetical protein VGP89_00650 [Candidatus Angelobacter sp.]|jgi:hypothetical protein|nr:hypothetical protein [Candidatus Angelobacter sp.]